MRVAQGFLALFCTAILFLLPVTAGIHDFRTDQRDETFLLTTANVTIANVSVTQAVYGSDKTEISLDSNLANEVPLVANYTAGGHVVSIYDLIANSTRTITVTYAVNALSGFSAMDTVLNLIPALWVIFLVGFIASSLAIIWLDRGA